MFGLQTVDNASSNSDTRKLPVILNNRHTLSLGIISIQSQFLLPDPIIIFLLRKLHRRRDYPQILLYPFHRQRKHFIRKKRNWGCMLMIPKEIVCLLLRMTGSFLFSFRSHLIERESIRWIQKAGPPYTELI